MSIPSGAPLHRLRAPHAQRASLPVELIDNGEQTVLALSRADVGLLANRKSSTLPEE
jgi:hypothetical protein